MNVALTIVGIVGPALLLVVAIRRWIVPLRCSVALLFLALTLAFLLRRSRAKVLVSDPEAAKVHSRLRRQRIYAQYFGQNTAMEYTRGIVGSS